MGEGQTPLQMPPPLLRTENREHDVWLGVGLRIEAASTCEATRRAIAWLRATLENAPPHDGLQVTTPALDLVEPVVRAIQQMGSQERAQTHEQAEQQGQVSSLVPLVPRT